MRERLHPLFLYDDRATVCLAKWGFPPGKSGCPEEKERKVWLSETDFVTLQRSEE